MVFGGRATGGQLGEEREALMNRNKESPFLSWSAQWKDSHLWTQKPVLTKSIGAFILDFSATRTMRNKMCCL